MLFQLLRGASSAQLYLLLRSQCMDLVVTLQTGLQSPSLGLTTGRFLPTCIYPLQSLVSEELL